MNKGVGGDRSVTVAVLVFPSSHYALRAEKICKEAGLPVLLIPLPREITSDCGVALTLPPEFQEKGEALLKQAGVPLTGSHRLTRTGRQALLWQRFLNR
ncbi:MAG: DUF3343 domain-containing protein [Firmicutes bacterium]|nr:DUF3343 domain-containing protein [Bacillota bacterium]